MAEAVVEVGSAEVGAEVRREEEVGVALVAEVDREVVSVEAREVLVGLEVEGEVHREGVEEGRILHADGLVLLALWCGSRRRGCIRRISSWRLCNVIDIASADTALCPSLRDSHEYLFHVRSNSIST